MKGKAGGDITSSLMAEKRLRGNGFEGNVSRTRMVTTGTLSMMIMMMIIMIIPKKVELCNSIF